MQPGNIIYQERLYATLLKKANSLPGLYEVLRMNPDTGILDDSLAALINGRRVVADGVEVVEGWGKVTLWRAVK